MLDLVSICDIYGCRPSELMAVEDSYTAFCLDEACALITAKMKGGEEPRFHVEYKSLKELYGSLGV